MTSLIGLYSPAPQSGKTTIANFLQARSYEKVAFADPIKSMTISLLLSLGLSEAEASRLCYTDKHELIKPIKVTARHMMQTLGTEYGRDCIHPQLWVMCWQNSVTAHLKAGNSVVCDDVRFPNEAHAILSLGGELWHIQRPGVLRTTTHSSEGALDDFPRFHRRLSNDGTLHDLHKRLKILIPEPALVP
jgi:hypothetical protein